MGLCFASNSQSEDGATSERPLTLRRYPPRQMRRKFVSVAPKAQTQDPNLRKLDPIKNCWSGWHHMRCERKATVAKQKAIVGSVK